MVSDGHDAGSKQPKQQKRGRTKYAKAPKYPGMSTLGSDMNELRYQKSDLKKTIAPSWTRLAALHEQQSGLLDHHAEVQTSKLATSLRKPQYRYDCEREILVDLEDPITDEDLGTPGHTDFGITGLGILGTLQRVRAHCRLVNHDAINPRLSDFIYCSKVEKIYRAIVNLQLSINEETMRLSATSETDKAEAKLFHLNALHRSLLQEHHDFMLAIHRSGVSNETRSMLIKDFMPDRLWEDNIRLWLEYLRQKVTDPLRYMLPFVDHVYDTLNSLHENIPVWKDLWDMVAKNLHNYLWSLHNNGLAIPEYYLQYWPSRKPPDNELGGDDLSEEERASNDDPLLYAMIFDTQTSNPNTATPRMDHSRDNDDDHDNDDDPVLPLKEPVKCFMAGWLTFGSRIATSFCAYCKTFKFLAWAGATF